MIAPALQLHGALLSDPQRRTYQAGLAESHQVACRVELLDQNEQVRSTIGGDGPVQVLGGQVDVDTTQPVTRQATLSLLDPQRKLALAPNGGGEYGLFAGDMVRVWRGDYIPTLGMVWCPVFTGPVTNYSSTWPEVSVQAVGKEALGLDPHLTLGTITIRHGTLLTSAIKRVLAPTGEAAYSFPALTHRLAHKLSLPRLSEPWVHAQHLARTANRQLYYDGRGRLVLRQHSSSPLFTFHDGDGGTLLGAPSSGYDFTSFRNTVDVVGGKPKKAKQSVHVLETVAGGNPLSPVALARHGQAQHLTTSINDSQLLRTAKAEALAKTTLRSALLLATDPSGSQFDTLPVPHLEERDRVRISLADGSTSLMELQRWTIPLTADSMPVGIHRILRWQTRYRSTRPGRRR
jgi:hypothetical protein